MVSPSTAADLWTWHGITVGQLVANAGIWTGVLSIPAIIARSRPAMRKMQIAADEKLRKDLMDRIALVERQADERVSKLEDKLERQRLEYEAKIAAKDAKFDKEMAIVRHRANNLAQCFDAMVMLMETDPDGGKKHLVQLKQMRSRQEQAEAAEKGHYADDKIASAAKPIKI